jgi:putative nucleotidyltransferase with HDIG domain
MANPEIILEQLRDLPSLPEIYIRVSGLLNDEESTAQKIGDTVQSDPSLTSKILKVVNSAYYGLSQPVTSISQTVALLGRERLGSILLGTVVEGLFSDMINFSLDDFWKHSIRTAIISRHLAMQNNYIKDSEALFTAGLLHDIGRLVIAKTSALQLFSVESLIRKEGKDALQAEMEVFGFSHADVGAVLLEAWELPELLVQCAKNHHQTDHQGSLSDATCIVYLANQLSHLPCRLTRKPHRTSLIKFQTGSKPKILWRIYLPHGSLPKISCLK